MKKLISFLTATVVFSLLFVYTASATNTSFFELFENLSKLDSYNVIQSIYGDFTVDSYGEKVYGEYRLNFNSTVNNKKEWEANEHSKISAYIELKTEDFDDNYKPFDKFVVEFRGEVTSIFADSIYIKLDHINMYGEGIDQFAQAGIDGVLETAKKYTGDWYVIQMNDFTENISDEMSYGLSDDFSDQEEVADKLRELGYKGFMMELSDEIFSMLLQENEISEEEHEQMTTAIDEVLTTNFFATRYLDRGYSEGFTAFRIDRSAITNLVFNLAEEFGENLSSYEINALRTMLNKVSLSGMYRFSDEYGIYDNFLLKFALRNVEELKNLHANLRYKVRNINSAAKVTAPDTAIDIMDTDLGMFLDADSYYDDYSYEEDWEDFECMGECGSSMFFDM